MQQQQQSSLKNIITRSIPGINLAQISVVEDTNADQYKSRFFAFIKGIPGEQSQESSTGRTYNFKNAVNMKIEAEKIYALASALRIAAEGKYEPYEKNFGHFEIFADSSRSGMGSGGEKKTVKVGIMQNNKTNKFVITMSFFADNKKAISYLTPYDAFGVAKMLEFCADKILELESQKNMGMTVQNTAPQQSFQPQQPQAQQPQNQQPQGQQPQNQQTPQEQNAVSGFQNMFPNTMEGMDEPPF